MRRTTTIRTRLLAALVGVSLIAAVGLSLYFLTQLEDYALRKLEERLSSQAQVVATLVGSYETRVAHGGTPDLTVSDAPTLERALTEAAPHISSVVRILDERGVTLADSVSEAGSGNGYSARPEVRKALRGDVGRATRLLPDDRVALYVAIPITAAGRVIGVSYVSSETFSIRALLRAYRLRLALAMLLYLLVTLALTELLARALSRPLGELEAGAAAFAAGDHSVRVRPSGSRETRAVAESFNELADHTERLVNELRDEERRKSRFVSDVSHELRTPLTAIRGAAETMLEVDVAEDDRQRFLTSIVTESDRLTRLANDLLTLQRIEGATGELPLSRVDLGEVVRKAAEALTVLSEERGVTVAVDGEAPLVLGDRDRLQQVIANLIDNATRMTPAGGTVRVTLAEQGASAELTITDGGPGIAEADLPHVFERFYRAQPSRDRGTGGAGLGLSIVKAIVTVHGGSIEASNPAEGGARFTVRLPALSAG
jgi:two-component system, OmpR family, sensor kinase